MIESKTKLIIEWKIIDKDGKVKEEGYGDIGE